MKKNIFLVGPMGAGKSSVGKYLARQLKMDFYDTDEQVELNTGVDLGWIFDVEGEEGFHKRETIVLADLVKLSNVVIATGGGTIMAAENRKMLKQNGMVIYLKVSLNFQPHRTVNESRRPLLRVQNRHEVLQQLDEIRTPLYEEIADMEILTDNCSVSGIANKIIDWYKKSI